MLLPRAPLAAVTLLILLGARAAPAQTAPTARELARAIPATSDTVWYITNRTTDGDSYTRTRGPLRAGFRELQLSPLRNDRVDFELRLDVVPLHDSTLAPQSVVSALRDRLTASTDGSLLVHIHGFATSWTRATLEAAEMKQRGGYAGPMLIFSWPARGIGLGWPSLDQIFSRAYWDDERVAGESAPDLARTLTMLATSMDASRIVVSAHSMGNQLLATALADSALQAQLTRTPLRALVFAAADVDRAAFRDTVLPRVQPLARHVVMYASRNDHMLRLSQLVHDGHPRAGQLDEATDWPSSLEVVDVTGGRSAAWWLGPLMDSNHSFRRDGTAMVDLFQVVLPGATPACRAEMGIATQDSSGVWRSTDAPLPPRPWMSDEQRAHAAPSVRCVAPALAPEIEAPGSQ